jgi:hypothetical protein
MSKIRDLKTNPNNCFNIVDAIELFVPNGKSKYTDMLLRVMNNTPNLKEHGDEIISHMTKTFEFIDKEELKKFNAIQLLLVYKFTDTYFNNDDLQNFRKFCDYNERNLINQNDLSTYKSFEDIITQVNVAEIKLEMKELENEVVRVHEDDEWLLVRPTTFLASKKYGANTKWCTTSESNPEYFLKYSERGVLIYCMNKKTGYKVASFYSLKASDPEFSFWNQKDTKIESMDSELSDSMLRIIRDVSKDPNAVSNRRLLEPEQLEKENKSLRKWMSIDSINNIVREYSMDSKPKVKESRLSRRIQNALRRDEEIVEDEMPVAIREPQPMEEAISYDMDGGDESYTDQCEEGPSSPMPF